MSRHGIFVLPEEPLRNACVPQMSVAENLALRTFDRPPQAKGIFLVAKAIRQMAQVLVDTFKVQAPSVDAPIDQLSGGNIQRAVLARELSANHIQLLIAANPCFGLDFASVDYIHAQLLAARNRGVAVLLVGEDLDELLKLSDRLLVISSGQLVYESKTQAVDFAAIGRNMAGH
jgi:simple sugar transport system ATP-binding protein